MSDPTDPTPDDAPATLPISADAQAMEDADAEYQVAREQALEAARQARLWHGCRSARFHDWAWLLGVLLAALGYPTESGTSSEFATNQALGDADNSRITRQIRKTALAILKSLERDAEATEP